jgi:SET domain-containing protein
VFNWGVLAKTSTSFAIALGFGSMYNHDNPSNMRYEAKIGQRILVFSTVRPVVKGEELTINYNALGGDPIWDNDHWFEDNNIKPITGSDAG